MKRPSVSVSLLIFLGVLLSRAQGQATVGTEAIAAQGTPATVTIVTFDANNDTLGQGSGFLIRSSGTVVTNWHVVRGAYSAVVILASGESYDRVLYIDGDSTRDVVLLQIPGSGLPVVPTRNDIPAVGSRVVVIGSPLGLARTVAEGILSATRMVDGQMVVQVSAPISHGSSGGPVMDTQGRVFAIATATLAEGQQLNFAVPVRYAVGLLALHSSALPLAMAPTATQESPTEAATAASSGNPTLSASVWTPARAAPPRSAISGTYALLRESVIANRGQARQPPTYGRDLLVLSEDGTGWMGFNCDSVGLCRSAFAVNGHTAASGDIAIDMYSDFAFDGYQTDDGLVAHAVLQSNDETDWLKIRGWYTSLPLSRRSGRYLCATRTQSWQSGYQGQFTDWRGDAVAVETMDSLYLDITLADAVGDTTGAFFTAQASGQLFVGRTGTSTPKQLTASWGAGSLSGTWVDSGENGLRLEGRLTCKRQ